MVNGYMASVHTSMALHQMCFTPFQDIKKFVVALLAAFWSVEDPKEQG